MRILLKDLQFAARMLRKNPGFTCVAVLTLALGIGANSAIFCIVNAVLLRPLPFPEPERLVMVWEDTPIFGLRDSPPAMGNYMDWRAHNRVFEDMAALERKSFSITGEGEPEQIQGGLVTASLFHVLGIAPALGRTFSDEEDQPGAPKVALLSCGLWRRRFGADTNAVGRPIALNGEKFTVVGVMPPSFHFPDGEDEIWVPVGSSFSRKDFVNRGRHDLMVVARLKRGVTINQANENIKAIAAQLQHEYPRTNAKVGAFVAPMHEHFVGELRRSFMVLLGAVGFVLLIACANVANLLLSRAANRRKEMVVRSALGASWKQIMRQLLAESLLLALLGSTSGLLLSAWSFRLLSRLVPRSIAAMTTVTIDYRVLSFTFGLTILTAVISGLAPMIRITRIDVSSELKQGGERTGTGRGSDRVRGALVIVEIALALVLLIGAGLLIRTFARLRGIDPGFRTKNILTLNVPLSPSSAKYREFPKRVAFYHQVLQRVRFLPGVVSAGFTTGLPLAFKGFVVGIALEGTASGAHMGTANYRVVTPDYLQTMGIPLREGRYLEDRDGPDAPRVALINGTMARNFWPNEKPLGKRFKLGLPDSDAPWISVVGVVGDVKQAGLDVSPKPEMYLPHEQERNVPSGLAIRTVTNPMSLAAAVRREIWAVDRDQPVSNVSTMEDILDREVFQRRAQTSILGVFAALALLLASLGIYGVLSYVVAQRTREIGIHMALGAQQSEIVRRVVGQGVALALAGVGVGLIGALGITRLMKSLLYGVSPTDPTTFVGTAFLLAMVAALASYLPARRASRVDPMIALRYE